MTSCGGELDRAGTMQQQAQGRGGGFGGRPAFAAARPAAPMDADAVARAIAIAKAAAARLTGASAVSHTGGGPSAVPGACPSRCCMRPRSGHQGHLLCPVGGGGYVIMRMHAYIAISGHG